MAHLGSVLRSRLFKHGTPPINRGVPSVRVDKPPEPQQTSLGDAHLFFAPSTLTPGPGTMRLSFPSSHRTVSRG